jgi:DNA topoisomerase I
MKLMIIESKGKVEKLTAILGDKWQVAASLGHVRDLPTNEMGVAEPNFRPEYQMTERGEQIIARLGALIKKADAIYLATDPDREGESISWHLQQCLKPESYQRVTFGEVTESAVKKAMLNPRAIDVKRVAAQEARRVLDRLVGYMVSPALRDMTGQNLSAGRVQSPAVRLVVDRERAIKAFKQTLHFGAALHFNGESGAWSANWLTKPDFVSDDNPYFLDRPFAQAVAAVSTVVVKSYEESEARRSPPAPFITSTMQQAASIALGLDPKAAMDMAQALYDKGHITYHRTDNPNISDESLVDIAAVAASLGLDMADKPRKFKVKADAQAGHPAVTPTHWDVEEAGETPEQRALYKLIRNRAIACQLADARFAVRTAILEAAEPVQGRAVAFNASGRTLVYQGWLKLIAGDQAEDEDEGENSKEPDNPVPALTAGQFLAPAQGRLVEIKTKAPSRYTQASLVKKLDAEGIGRPATYAAIMDNIVGREYVATVKKFLVPTATGELIVDSLVGKFEFLNLGFTRELETDLDRIEKGEAGYKAVIQRAYDQLKQELIAFHASAPPPKNPCPECGKALRRIKGKSGFFWGCTGYPDCSVSLPDEGGKPGQKKPQEASNFTCALCNSLLIHRVKKGAYNFWGCSAFKATGCKGSYQDKEGKPVYATAK